MLGSFKIVQLLERLKPNGIRPWHKIWIKSSNNLKQTGLWYSSIDPICKLMDTLVASNFFSWCVGVPSDFSSFILLFCTLATVYFCFFLFCLFVCFVYGRGRGLHAALVGVAFVSSLRRENSNVFFRLGGLWGHKWHQWKTNANTY